MAGGKVGGRGLIEDIFECGGGNDGGGGDGAFGSVIKLYCCKSAIIKSLIASSFSCCS